MCRQEQLRRCEDKESDGNEGQTILVIGQTEQHADGGVAEREELLEDAPLYIVCRNIRMNLICHQFTDKFSSARPFLSPPERMYQLWRVLRKRADVQTCRRLNFSVKTPGIREMTHTFPFWCYGPYMTHSAENMDMTIKT